MSRSNARWAVVLTLIVVLVFAVAGGAIAKKGGEPGPPSDKGHGGGGEEAAGNNLSFPAIAVDGFQIPTIEAEVWGAPYDGDYPELTPEQRLLVETGSWYPQKSDSTWIAENVAKATEDVTWVDWGDSIESVNPKVGTPTRLEVTLYKDLDPDETGLTTMSGFVMELLEYPSSPNELQGTNQETYDSRYATVISGAPRLVVQHLGDPAPTTNTWLGSQWQFGTIVTGLSFAPELNIGGKYIYGASVGGWKPRDPGWYRITFYLPGSQISLLYAQIGNWATLFTGPTEGTAATPVVDISNNLTYVDVLAVAKGTGGGGGKNH